MQLIRTTAFVGDAYVPFGSQCNWVQVRGMSLRGTL